MQLHRNAKTTPKGRALIVQRVDVDGWTVTQTAGAFGVSVRTVHKWRARHDTEGLAGLLDRDSTPHRSPERTSQRQVAAIVALRTQRLSGTRIAQRLGVVSRPRRAHRARDDRQRLRLSLPRLRGALCPARDAPSAHSPLHAADQWQGRALHPDTLARVGVFPALRHLGSPPPCTRSVAPLLQPAPTTLRAMRPPSHLSTPGDCGMNNVLGNDN